MKSSLKLSHPLTFELTSIAVTLFATVHQVELCTLTSEVLSLIFAHGDDELRKNLIDEVVSYSVVLIFEV